MSVEIFDVIKNSPAYKAELKKGDKLVSVDGNEINDVLDYMFYTAYDEITLEWEHNGKRLSKKVFKSEYDDLGLEFESFLMDKKQSCKNKCVFCFIDQMPPGMRETLYFKDDDARLSFLQGNYVTLTNLTDKDIERIVNMRLNINVSVHTTNPELRCKMMNNRFAGEKLKYLKQIADSGLMLNCQIVLCPGLNDGEELQRTLDDLEALMPNVSSVAVVPVGLTKFREGLYPLEPFTAEKSAEALEIIEKKQQECLEKYGTRMVFASDEFYINAKRELPLAEYYEDYPQYENGVGLMRSLIDEFTDALSDFDGEVQEREFSVATGKLAFPLMKQLALMVSEKFPQVKINVYEIINHFFGETITVAGLITAGDMIDQLKGKNLGEMLYIPKVMLKADEDVFLDDLTVSDVEKELGVSVCATTNDGYELADAWLLG
ncbi:MAG: DUF512 domain-containing protein [Oscillospiraceae bacterium]|nr:DUF512 domain-containing protein [Oscillospiraceae bacterium]